MRHGLMKQKKYGFQMFTKSFDCHSNVAEFGRQVVPNSWTSSS